MWQRESLATNQPRKLVARYLGPTSSNGVLTRNSRYYLAVVQLLERSHRRYRVVEEDPMTHTPTVRFRGLENLPHNNHVTFCCILERVCVVCASKCLEARIFKIDVTLGSPSMCMHINIVMTTCDGAAIKDTDVTMTSQGVPAMSSR